MKYWLVEWPSFLAQRDNANDKIPICKAKIGRAASVNVV